MTTISSLHGRARSALVRAETAIRGDRGAIMAEYGMLIFFVGTAALAILVLFGGEVWELFRETEEGFDSSRKTPPPPD